MAKKIVIERLEGKGVMAEVIDAGERYSAYEKFAKAAGYTDAVNNGIKCSDIRGEVVNVLAKGNHGQFNETIYVCQLEGGGRFLIGAPGIDIIEIPTLKTATFEALLGELMERIQVGEGEMPRAKPTRADIVAQAKSDIEDLKDSDGYYEAGWASCNAEFIVNADKRTVAALMRGYSSNIVRAKGIAKCDPSDCFNEHIGKAIALRRALGLDVPSEYLNAPQPEGVQVGDVVLFDDDLVPHRVDHDHAILVIRPIPNIHLSCALEYGNTVINDSARY